MEKNHLIDFELQALNIEDPVEYIHEITERTTQKILYVLVEPPIETINAIRLGIFMILNTIYAKPEQDLPSDINFVSSISQSTSNQTNLRIDFFDYYKQVAYPLKNLVSGDIETKRKFEEFLKTLINPVN